jgi:hypothetical protein
MYASKKLGHASLPQLQMPVTQTHAQVCITSCETDLLGIIGSFHSSVTKQRILLLAVLPFSK